LESCQPVRKDLNIISWCWEFASFFCYRAAENGRWIISWGNNKLLYSEKYENSMDNRGEQGIGFHTAKQLAQLEYFVYIGSRKKD
jgi:hypothetical protein